MTMMKMMMNYVHFVYITLVVAVFDVLLAIH